MRGKRAMDVSLSLAALRVFAPVAAAAALCIRLEDGGPVLFVQERVGRGRRPFSIPQAPHDARARGHARRALAARDGGSTRRRSSSNVLRGDMSIVGPRPLTPADVERLGWSGAEHDARFAVRPGITGLAQVLGGRSARHTRALDALYARRAGAALDLSLIAISFAMNLAGKRRVRAALRRLALRRAALRRAARRGARVGQVLTTTS
ncbi:MAG: sugar transferase [Sandaracinaceae bacterium]|nr:sugar transferase [Sandaracinaceae bacterium]